MLSEHPFHFLEKCQNCDFVALFVALLGIFVAIALKFCILIV